MANELRGYNPQAVVITWAIGGEFGTIDIADGRIDGVFLSETKDGPRWTRESDGNNNHTRVKQPNRGGFFALTLSASSPTNAALSAAALADDETEVVTGLATAKDLNGNTIVEYDSAFIEDIPNLSRGNTRGENAWIFQYANRRPFLGGHDLE